MKREDVVVDGAEGVLKSDNPPPEEAGVATVDNCCIVDAPWLPELVSNPAA